MAAISHFKYDINPHTVDYIRFNERNIRLTAINDITGDVFIECGTWEATKDGGLIISTGTDAGTLNISVFSPNQHDRFIPITEQEYLQAHGVI